MIACADLREQHLHQQIQALLRPQQPHEADHSSGVAQRRRSRAISGVKHGGIHAIVEDANFLVRDAEIGLQMLTHGFAIGDHGVRHAVSNPQQRVILQADQVAITALAGDHHRRPTEASHGSREDIERRVKGVNRPDAVRLQVRAHQPCAFPRTGAVQRGDGELQDGNARRAEFRRPHAIGENGPDVYLETLWIQPLGKFSELALRASRAEGMGQ